MILSPEGVDFIEHEEGLRLAAYKDAGGVLTIGYGHTGSVPGRGPILETMTITAAEADMMLRSDVQTASQAVDHAVFLPTLKQGQFDAMVSLAFNVGRANFAGSTLVRMLNQGDVYGAAQQFVRWSRVGGVVNDVLLGRRAREMWMFARAT